MKQGRPRLHTDEEILDALRAFYITHKRAPREREMRGMNHAVPVPSVSLLKARWGSKLKAFEKAGIPPNPVGGQMVHGRRMELMPIDPEKAEAVTRAKRAYWQEIARGKHGLLTWTHPYSRRSA